MVTMSQKSSLREDPQFVSWVLIPDILDSAAGTRIDQFNKGA
jgi:hypothetical protein